MLAVIEKNCRSRKNRKRAERFNLCRAAKDKPSFAKGFEKLMAVVGPSVDVVIKIMH